MFTFFRKIRKSLIDSGSARRYFFYAIGEIALVVIGILIALQINNWNQDRLNRIEEKNILASISKNMALIQDYCQVCGRVQQDVMWASSRLLEAMNSSDYPDSTMQIEKNLAALFKRCFVGEGLTENIYDVLKSSDQLELIRSRALRDELGTLDSWLGTTIPYDILQAEFVDQQLKPFINQYIDRTQLPHKLINDPASLIVDTSAFDKRLKNDYEVLLSQRAFSNLLVDLKMHTMKIISMYEFIGRSIDVIDSLLVVELPALEPEVAKRSK